MPICYPSATACILLVGHKPCLHSHAMAHQVREDIKRGCYVEGLSEEIVQNGELLWKAAWPAWGVHPLHQAGFKAYGVSNSSTGCSR